MREKRPKDRPDFLRLILKNVTFGIRMDHSGANTTDSFRSVAAPAYGLFKDRGSRFISSVYPVETEEEIKGIITALRKEYHDARHCCYAYRLGHLGDRFRSSDDGEPSGTAGRQILGQIDSAGLSDVLLAVVRYFGGIKLGVPGLIRAYRTASSDAIANAEIIQKTACRRFRLSFGYLNMNDVMKVIKDLSLNPTNQDFGASCRLEAEVRLTLADAFLAAVSKVEGCAIEEI